MKIPQHLGIIIDGNRRWARKKGLPPYIGHKKGMNNVKKIAKYCAKLGVKYLTIFAFSTENWKRDKNEVNFLMRLLKSAISGKNLQELMKNNVKLNIIGEIKRLPLFLQKQIKKSKELTKNNTGLVLTIALSYGGRRDIVNAVKKILQKNIQPQEVNEELISRYLWTKNLPDPDLIIRTGREKRISNFLIWQMAYSELYFSSKFWPDFSEEDIDKAFLDYSRRQRRFGK